MAKNAHLTLDQRATIEVSLREGLHLLRLEENWVKIHLPSQKKLRTIVRQYAREVIIPALSASTVLIWGKLVNHVNTHITVPVKDAHTESAMNIALILLNLHVRS